MTVGSMLRSAIDVAARTKGDYDYEQHVVVDRVDDVSESRQPESKPAAPGLTLYQKDLEDVSAHDGLVLLGPED